MLRDLEEIPPEDSRDPYLPVSSYAEAIRLQRLADDASPTPKAWDPAPAPETPLEDTTELPPESQLTPDQIDEWEAFGNRVWRINDSIDVWDSKSLQWYESNIIDIAFANAPTENGSMDADEDPAGVVELIDQALSHMKNSKEKRKLRNARIRESQTEIEETQTIRKISVAEIKVHFKKWASKWDTWVELDKPDVFRKAVRDPVERESLCVAPQNFFTKPATKAQTHKIKPKIFHVSIDADADDDANPEQGQENAMSNGVRRTTKNRYLLCHACFTLIDTVNVSRTEYETCIGTCKRSYHRECGFRTEYGQGSVCRFCETGKQPCSICHTITSETTFQCEQETCTKFYHLACLETSFPQVAVHRDDAKPSKPDSTESTLTDGASPPTDGTSPPTDEPSPPTDEPSPPTDENTTDQDTAPTPQPRFTCPVHRCATCKTAAPSIRSCTKCPLTYCAACLPGGIRVNDAGMITCDPHLGRRRVSSTGRPPVPVQAPVHESFEGPPQSLFSALSTNLPRDVPLLNQPKQCHFRLSKNIILEGAKKPPAYQHIKSNVHLCKMKEDADICAEKGDQCSCSANNALTCGGACPNRVLHIECFGDAKKSDVEIKRSKKKHYGTNCSLASECTNRQFQSRKYKSLVPFPTLGMGWGLKAGEDIQEGDFVIEYLGEVLSTQESTERLQQQAARNDEHVFHMELDKDRVIDARYKGNASRFINHSCDPNCELQKWNVKGKTRIGIFAVKPIPAGTELTYDYQFMSSDLTLVCLCGTEKCRGTLAMLSQKERKEMAAKEVLESQTKKLKRMLHRNNGIISGAVVRRYKREEQEFKKRIQEKREKAMQRDLKRANLTPLCDVTKGPVPFQPALGSLEVTLDPNNLFRKRITSDQEAIKKKRRLQDNTPSSSKLFAMRTARIGARFSERLEMFTQKIAANRADKLAMRGNDPNQL